MKNIFYLIIILFLIPFWSCEKDDADYDDENTVIPVLMPGLSVYKTKGDYFDKIIVGIDSTGKISYSPIYEIDDTRITYDGNTAKFKNRWKLKNGFVVDYEGVPFGVCTDVTLTEQVRAVERFVNIDDVWYQKRIVDTNPFEEYYLSKASNSKTYTLKQINNMIEDGTIINEFTKLK